MTDLGPPKRYQDIKAKYPDILDAYEKLSSATKKAGPLDEKTVALIKLGISIGARAEGATHSAVRKALKAGASPEEIRHAVFLSTTTIGFPNMMAALSWADDILEKTGE